MYWREFSNFSRYCVAFPSEANAALGFLFTFWAKPKSKIRPIGQKKHHSIPFDRKPKNLNAPGNIFKY